VRKLRSLLARSESNAASAASRNGAPECIESVTSI
jgi:hypothetical protein